MEMGFCLLQRQGSFLFPTTSEPGSGCSPPLSSRW